MCSDAVRGLCLALLGLLPAAAARGQEEGFPTADEVLALAFPEARAAVETLPLDEAQRERIAVRSGAAWHAATAVRYVLRRDGAVVGTAMLDTRRVRTHRQTLLIMLDGSGKVHRIETLAFAEPRQYRPRPAFLEQFQGKDLDDGVQLRRGIRPVAGATLSARATTDAVRTALAVHEVLPVPTPEPQPEPEPGPKPPAPEPKGGKG